MDKNTYPALVSGHHHRTPTLQRGFARNKKIDNKHKAGLNNK